MCEPIPTSSSRSMNDDILCDYCGRKGHKKDKCWAKQRDERGDAKPDKGKGKAREKKGGKGDRKGEPGTPRGGKPPSAKGDKGDKGGKGGGKDKKGKGKGKDKQKKKKKNAARSLEGEPESEAESSTSGHGATVMAMRFSQPLSGRGELSPARPEKSEPVVLKPLAVEPPPGICQRPPASESLGTLASISSKGDVEYICSSLCVEGRDVWLVDSGATCHMVSSSHISGFRVTKYHDRNVTLYNASGGTINVSSVVDLEVRFGDVPLTLEEVLVADVPFNAISPWAASERGWKTHLARTGSRLYRGGKKNIRLIGERRAW